MWTSAAFLLCASVASARHRLEPPDGRQIHCGGQESGNFEAYSAFLGPLGPAMRMYYNSIPGLNSTAPGAVPAYFTDMAAQLQADGAPDGAFIIPQLGLQLPLNGQESLVGSGAYDNAISALVSGLVALARPAFIRVGYEFNGPWNSYKPATYVSAYRRIAAAIRGHPLLNSTVALVWDGSCDTAVDPTPFFPGSDVVDWQGVNIFSGASAPTATAAGQCLAYWLTDSAAAGYPLMLGESSPRGLNTSHPATLAAWHAPYLSLLARTDTSIKAFCYIDEDWEATPRWKGWGESRIEVAAQGLKDSWRAGLSRQAVANRAQKAQVLQLLGLERGVYDEV